MRKIFGLLFLFFIFFSGYYQTKGSQEIKIISRSEWGANEEYRFIDSIYWQEIIERENQKRKLSGEFISTEDTIAYLFNPDYRPDIEEYLERYFSISRKKSEKISYENGRELFWPLEKSNNIQGIVIHHTATEYNNDYEGIQNIYKIHALSNKWGDIGYNFLIGENGDIYEGRAGGENTVGAHDKWNNIGNIGISVMGNYEVEDFNDRQKESLEKLIKYLVEKYNIDLNKKEYYHMECIEDYCRNPLESELLFPLIGHRDAGHTTCPGEKGYEFIQELRKKLQDETSKSVISYQKLERIFDKYPTKQLIYVSSKLSIIIETENNLEKKEMLSEVGNYLIFYLRNERYYIQ